MVNHIHMHRIIIVLFLLSGSFLLNSCSKDDETAPTSTGTGGGTTTDPARQAALNDYNANYLGSYVSSPSWSGNVSTCNAGRCSNAASEAVIKRINYFRRMVGLNDNCELDTSLIQQQQDAALMLSANGALSHNPPTTWSCYTTSGSQGCQTSNIALGYHSSAAITAFIFDDGSGNEPVGHRRWILHTNKKYFTYGSTSNAMALYVLRSTTNSNPPAYIPYPPKGWIPKQLVPARWSFSIRSANFSSATVSMTGPGGANVPVTVISRTANGYGDNTIVWTPTGIDTTSPTDVSYTVTISGIVNAPQSSYTYTTTLFRP